MIPTRNLNRINEQLERRPSPCLSAIGRLEFPRCSLLFLCNSLAGLPFIRVPSHSVFIEDQRRVRYRK
jgi:hypothetical protein